MYLLSFDWILCARCFVTFAVAGPEEIGPPPDAIYWPPAEADTTRSPRHCKKKKKRKKKKNLNSTILLFFFFCFLHTKKNVSKNLNGLD